jgi:hypothetical protein
VSRASCPRFEGGTPSTQGMPTTRARLATLPLAKRASRLKSLFERVMISPSVQVPQRQPYLPLRYYKVKATLGAYRTVRPRAI